ncbi:hypothetical protein [Lactiplantibacillus plantarum]|uniref:hypothetical protein n=1 Tax=Lactiplantibacillus plantarum TaxID=1590 RepID=UPI0011C9483D|nr:hypothetical protein [Lactiplantibacillus plantarum]MDO8183248.1 hypothetical protein [Lactiplantibacillus plantarum]TXJ90447.1 hypothetical protein FU657_15415 [Lactiplantibacillus plantarum]
MKFYRKQPIEAEQFDGSEEMIDKYHVRCDTEYMLSDDPLEYSTVPYQMETLEGFLNINAGDWIATGIDGEHWPIADDVFKKTYAELPVISEKLDSYIQLYKRNNYGITDMLYDLTDEVCPDANLTKDDIARAWLDGYQVEGHK